VKGPDGNLWFTEIAAQKVGRLTPAGDMTEYTLPVAGEPFGITDGPDHYIWVTVPAAHVLCRIRTDGHATAFYLPITVTPSFITAGPDGNLWFTEPSGKIGRFTPSGFLAEFSSTPQPETAAAPDEPAANRRLLFVPP
jgi:virginiamycin B lyase